MPNKKILRQILFTIFAFIAIGCVAYLDYKTGTEISPVIFYLIPVAYFASNKLISSGSVICQSAFAASCWFYVESITKIYTNLGILWFNALAVFVVILSTSLLLKVQKKDKQ